MPTPHTTLRLPPGAKAQLDYLCRRRGESAAQVICYALAVLCRPDQDAPEGGTPAKRGRPPAGSGRQPKSAVGGRDAMLAVASEAPASSPHVAPLQRAVTRTIEPADIRVLVVDDDAATRAITAAPLRRDEFQVTEADSIESALASVRSSQIDVMVLDMCMPNPEGDADDAGLVVLREIAKGAAKPNVIVFTPGISALQKRAARKLGAFVVLNKAQHLRQLGIQVCSAWLQGEEDREERNRSKDNL